jgi:hypothetical protein
MQDPDLESARFEILDFSCPSSSKRRELVVIDAKDVPRVTNERKTIMLEAFAEGYLRALSALSREQPQPDFSEDGRDPNQPSFFD